jgi:hypothetical protein
MPFSCNSNRDITAIVETARLLKPVSRVQILRGTLPGALLPDLPGALCAGGTAGALEFAQFSDGFRAFAYGSGSFWSVRGSVTVWHQMTHLGWRWSLVPRR